MARLTHGTWSGEGCPYGQSAASLKTSGNPLLQCRGTLQWRTHYDLCSNCEWLTLWCEPHTLPRMVHHVSRAEDVLPNTAFTVQGCGLHEEDVLALGDALCNLTSLTWLGLPAEAPNDSEPRDVHTALPYMLVTIASRAPQLAHISVPCFKQRCLADSDMVSALTDLVRHCTNLYDLHIGEGIRACGRNALAAGNALRGAATLSEALQQRCIGGCDCRLPFAPVLPCSCMWCSL
jgi:hypothetical protein